MHRLATVHARGNQRPTTNDVTTQPIPSAPLLLT